mmetsp:Transcript_48915/g.96470  ORF Transcript_48915/g.96470 Transcript_48915/m.96470 type:complete len:429 (-) Transcript_48915:153-1439(-)
MVEIQHTDAQPCMHCWGTHTRLDCDTLRGDCYLQGCLQVFALHHRWFEQPVRHQQSVHVEVAVMFLFSKIAPVGPKSAVSLSGKLLRNKCRSTYVPFSPLSPPSARKYPLVDPIPHEPALQTLLFGPASINQILPIPPMAPVAVAHCVTVLAHDHGSVVSLRTQLFQHLKGGIHRADDVRDLRRALLSLKLNGSGVVFRSESTEGRTKVRSHTRLVPQRPHNDGRVIGVPLCHPSYTRHPLRSVGRVRREPGEGHTSHLTKEKSSKSRPPEWIVSMTLDVGLVNHEDPNLVAQQIEVPVIGVVGAPDRVEVVSLHQQQVLFHGISCHRFTSERVVFVSVGSSDPQGFPIQAQSALFNRHSSETDTKNLPLRGECNRGGTLRHTHWLQGETRCVEVGAFIRPRLSRHDRQLQLNFRFPGPSICCFRCFS